MTIILNGTTGVTFPDGTTQTDGIATPVPIADGGTGSATAADARTALSAAKSGANSDITSITGLTTALSVAQGGTGATTLTANNVLLGNGTSALQAVAPGSNGNILTSNGTTWVSSAPAGGGVTSAVAGNGIAVSGATGAVTFSVAAPSWNSIGSYVLGTKSSSGNADYNNTYSAGSTGVRMLSCYTTSISCNVVYVAAEGLNVLSGTWRAMTTASQYTGMALFVRVA